MHLFDPVNRFSCSGIIGASLPPACGAGLAAKKLGKDWVAVAFFGEGAANQGAVHESLNLAALWKLPVIFVCEDNKWAISVPKSSATSIEWVADRAAGYGMPGIKVATNDAMAVYEAAGPAIARARRGEGPSLIEVKTDRYLGHFQGDPETYRPKGETEALRKNDPIPHLAQQLRSPSANALRSSSTRFPSPAVRPLSARIHSGAASPSRPRRVDSFPYKPVPSGTRQRGSWTARWYCV